MKFADWSSAFKNIFKIDLSTDTYYLSVERKLNSASIFLNVSRIKGKNIICTPFLHNGTPFLMCHKVQGIQYFITLTQTLDSEKNDWDSIFWRSCSKLDTIF